MAQNLFTFFFEGTKFILLNNILVTSLKIKKFVSLVIDIDSLYINTYTNKII